MAARSYIRLADGRRTYHFDAEGQLSYAKLEGSGARALRARKSANGGVEVVDEKLGEAVLRVDSVDELAWLKTPSSKDPIAHLQRTLDNVVAIEVQGTKLKLKSR